MHLKINCIKEIKFEKILKLRLDMTIESNIQLYNCKISMTEFQQSIIVFYICSVEGEYIYNMWWGGFVINVQFKLIYKIVFQCIHL